MNLADQGRLLFLITHYTDKVLLTLYPLKIIDKYPELLEFYNNLYEANNIMMPLTFYVTIMEQLISIAKGTDNLGHAALKIIRIMLAINYEKE